MQHKDHSYNVLDHGYVKLIETWGSDQRIVEAARMSTNKGFNGWGPFCDECKCNSYSKDIIEKRDTCPGCGLRFRPGDEQLLDFLYRNNHSTPFEMGGMIIEVQAPIFVFREWHRHRTQSYNEASARYAPLPELDYVPTIDRIMINAGTSNKQAGTISTANNLTHEFSGMWLDKLTYLQSQLEKHYQDGLRNGVPKELARLSMTVGRYSKMRASANLRNWLAFMTLRCANNAQWEIRQYANIVANLIKDNFPRTYDLFEKYSKK